MRSRLRLLATLAGLVLAALPGACRTASPRSGATPGSQPQAEARPAASPAGGAPSAALDRSVPPRPGPAPRLEVPPQDHFQLSNGLKVRLVQAHELPIVSLHLVVDAGAVHDPPAQPGLASFTAGMLTEGTKRRSATQISDDLGFVGATLSAGAGFDSASLSGSVLVAHLPELLDVFADVLVDPTFPPGDFARVQDQRLVSLVQQRDQPGVVAAKAFMSAYWGDYPYGHWPLGTERSVRSTRREDLVRYHAERWRPGASELVVVGDVTVAPLTAMLEKALASWRGPAPASVPPPAPPPHAPKTILVQKRGPAPQSYVMMGMPGFARSSPDFVAAQVAFEILGGGTSSRLFRDLREKLGYTYGIYARPDARKLGGASLVVGSVRADVTGAATRELLAQLASIRDVPVGAEELEVARNALLLSLPADFAVNAGIAAKIAEEVVYGLPDDYWNVFARKVAEVSAGDVERVARAYLDPGALTTVMVCDPAAVQPQLAGLPLGPIEVRAAPGSEPAPPRKAPPKKRRPGPRPSPNAAR